MCWLLRNPETVPRKHQAEGAYEKYMMLPALTILL